MRFRPTRPAAGRLLRLGLVLDTRNAPDRFREIARIAERAGVDALWVADPAAAAGQRTEAWTGLTLAMLDTSDPRMGAMLETAWRSPELLAAMAHTLAAAAGARLEIGLRGAAEALAPELDLASYASRLRELGVAAPFSLDVSSGGIGAAARIADDVVVRGRSEPDLLEAIGQIRAACRAAGRDPDTLGIAVELPVSIGRTATEAEARARAEESFRLPSAAAAIVGTLEQCQDRVLGLAHAGVTELRCQVPNSPDVHDVIAQLTAVVVGNVGVLTPGAPRSPAPAPPEGWGGRSTRPGDPTTWR